MRRIPTPAIVAAAVFACLLTATLGVRSAAETETRSSRKTAPTADSESRGFGLLTPGLTKVTPMVPMTPEAWDTKPSDEKKINGPFDYLNNVIDDLFTDDDETPGDLPEPSAAPSESKEPGIVRRGIDALVPGAKQLPDWVLPIVARAESRKAPGTVVSAYMDLEGRAVITGQAIAYPGTRGPTKISNHDQQGVLVSIKAVVEDPTKATPKSPAQVTVKVVNPETGVAVFQTAEITSPKKAANVTEKLTEEIVRSDEGAVVLGEAAPSEEPRMETREAPAEEAPQEQPQEPAAEPTEESTELT